MKVTDKTHKSFLFQQMENVVTETITPQQANAVANLSGKATSIERLKQNRASLEMKIRRHNLEFNDKIKIEP